MIENGGAIKSYLTLMLKDYASVTEDYDWYSPVDNKSKRLKSQLPVLIQAYEHYQNSSEDFLKLERPIPRLKEIVDFYGELIALLKEKFTHDLFVLMRIIEENPAPILVRVDTSGEALRKLNELENILFDSLVSAEADEKIDEKLEELTEFFLSLPLPSQDATNFNLSDEILKQQVEYRHQILADWFELLDEYWLARTMK